MKYILSKLLSVFMFSPKDVRPFQYRMIRLMISRILSFFSLRKQKRNRSLIRARKHFSSILFSFIYTTAAPIFPYFPLTKVPDIFCHHLRDLILRALQLKASLY